MGIGQLSNRDLDGPRLPALVGRYLERALLGGSEAAPQRVRVGQAGEMWLKPGGRSLRFTAVEEFAVEKVAFAWRARFPLAPLIAMNVDDGYSDGEGELHARLLGIPVMRQAGSETAVGEALRYLAELPWIPHAMRANRALEWHELDAHAVEVSTRMRSQRLAVRVDFDHSGDVVRTSCQARPRPVGKTFVPTSWAGEFGDYAILGGTRIPTTAEVSWELPEGRFVYWRGRITALELLDAEPRRSELTKAATIPAVGQVP